MQVFAALILLVVILVLYMSTRKPKNFPPGPARLPLIGTIWKTHLTDWTTPTFIQHRNLTKVYGKIIGHFFILDPVVAIFDYDLAKEVFNRNESAGRPHLDVSKFRTFGKLRGVLLNDGISWHSHRRFALQHLRDLGMGRGNLEDIVQREVGKLIARIDSMQATPINMRLFFNTHILNVLWEIVAGNTFEPDDPRIQVIMKALNDFLQATQGLSSVLSIRLGALCRPLGGSLYQSLATSRDKLREIFDAEIEKHISTLDTSSPRDFIDLYLIQMGKNANHSHEFDELGLHAILQDLFLAGSETTSTTLEWLIRYMLLFPEVKSRTHEELDAVVGRGRRVLQGDRLHLPYTEAVLAETMRMSSIVNMAIPHRALDDIHVGGYIIPKDTWIAVHIYAIHFDEGYWGDPYSFRPERFLKDGKFVADKRLIPFGIGKRSCMGESLARQESFLFLANLLHEYDVRIPPGDPTPAEGYVTGTVCGPPAYRAQFIKRRR